MSIKSLQLTRRQRGRFGVFTAFGIYLKCRRYIGKCLGRLNVKIQGRL